MSFFNEMFADSGNARLCYSKYLEWLNAPEQKNLTRRKEEAENVFRRTGITFNVYSEKEETEKLIPFDLIPRILTGDEWRIIQRGVEQRVKAINSFLFDIYHHQEIIKAGIIPRSLIEQNKAFLQRKTWKLIFDFDLHWSLVSLLLFVAFDLFLSVIE